MRREPDHQWLHDPMEHQDPQISTDNIADQSSGETKDFVKSLWAE